MLRELKITALFYPKAMIRDSDIASNPDFQNILATDVGGIWTAVERGSLSLAIRSTASSFFEVNELVGRHRAFPERYEQSKVALQRIDAYIQSHDVLCPEFDVDLIFRNFDRLVRRESQNPELDDLQRQNFSDAISYAEAEAVNGAIRFGHIHEFLRQSGVLASSRGILDICHSAHMLAIPASYGMLLSSTSDNPVSMDSAILGACGRQNHQSVDFGAYLPRLVLTDAGIDALSFLAIERARALGRAMGYFDAFARLQLENQARGGTVRPGTYRDFLSVLVEYIRAIGVETRTELIDWREMVVKRLVAQENLYRRVWAFVIPICVAVPAGLAGYPVLSGLSFVIGGVGFFLEARASRTPSALQQLIDGTFNHPVELE